MQRKKLPIGIQTFREIRENGHYYVDKTPLILRLIDRGKPYFLSRPRRFGKSLLLDTIKELFEGRRELFTGLHADTHWDWSVTHPVVRLSFGAGVLKTSENLAASMHRQLSRLEREHQVTRSFEAAGSRLADLIETLHERTGQRVVVLVDEYDKPILDNLTEPEIARTMREGLRDIYSVLKDADAHLRFIFIAGVSKFSKVSLFSGLNNLNDITVSPEYSALCGYTDRDVDTVFAPELAGFDRDDIRRWYNGYSWRGESVYNPFDLLLLFEKREFRSYWFETGTPTFLVDLLAEKRFFTPDFASLKTTEALLSSFDVDHIEPEALLWQAGYLTIHKVTERRLGQFTYTLGYPNTEVEIALNEAFLPQLGPVAQVVVQTRDPIQDALEAGDMPGVQAALHTLYASIPNDWYRKSPLAGYEGHYVSIFYSYLTALGLAPRVEDATNKGRIDLAVRVDNRSAPSLQAEESAPPCTSRLYLFEFKVVEQVPDGRAIEQLNERGYAEKYRAPGVGITLVGIEFSSEKRNLVRFEVAAG